MIRARQAAKELFPNRFQDARFQDAIQLDRERGRPPATLPPSPKPEQTSGAAAVGAA
jgi:hypothetical protein